MSMPKVLSRPRVVIDFAALAHQRRGRGQLGADDIAGFGPHMNLAEPSLRMIGRSRRRRLRSVLLGIRAGPALACPVSRPIRIRLGARPRTKAAIARAGWHLALGQSPGADEAGDGGLVGEDADHLGAALDLAVEALERVGNRHDARGDPGLGGDLVIFAYGATIRAAGRWEHEAWAGRCVR
jgi:hypothetical protein